MQVLRRESYGKLSQSRPDLKKYLIPEGFYFPPGWHSLCKPGNSSKTQKEGTTMPKRIGRWILAGTLALMVAVPMTTLAGPGGKSQAVQNKTSNTQQIQQRQRLRDGSCVNPAKANSGTVEKKGKTYGPGDGTGNLGIGPKDGTGYGAPSQR
jgi:hypothetical protein